MFTLPWLALRWFKIISGLPSAQPFIFCVRCTKKSSFLLNLNSSNGVFVRLKCIISSIFSQIRYSCPKTDDIWSKLAWMVTLPKYTYTWIQLPPLRISVWGLLRDRSKSMGYLGIYKASLFTESFKSCFLIKLSWYQYVIVEQLSKLYRVWSDKHNTIIYLSIISFVK